MTVTVKGTVVAHSPAVGVKVYVLVAVLLTSAGLQVPLIPLFDVGDKMGLVDPEQIGAIGVKVGTIFGLTIIVKEVVVAHCPAVGVKVYVPVVVLSTVEGFQIPVYPSFDVDNKIGLVAPEHIGAIAIKLGTTNGFTVTVKPIDGAHCPASGVKIYVPVVVLSTNAGLQEPVIPLFDAEGKTGLVDPEHIGAIAVKTGVLIVTVTLNDAFVTHCPGIVFGVKV